MKKILLSLSLLAVIAVPVTAQKKALPAHKPGAKAAPASPAANGKKVYVKYCLSCHQADGGGVMNMNPPLTASPYVQGDKQRIITILLTGFNQGVEINGQTYTNAMPSFSYLKDKEIADVLTYVRSHFKNKAGAVKVAEVTPIRAALKK